MISIDPTWLIIMGEIMIALVVVVVAVLVVFVKSRRRDHAAVQTLQSKINSNAPQRQALFEQMLASTEEDSEEDAVAKKEMAASWVNKENEFYGSLVDMYLKRNATALKGLDKMLHEYTSSYLDLVTLMRDRVESGQIKLSEEAQQRLGRMAEEGERLDGRVKALEGENRILNKELKDAYREIEQTMREYTKAFRPSGVAASVGSVASQVADATPTQKGRDEVNDDDVAALAEALDDFPAAGEAEESSHNTIAAHTDEDALAKDAASDPTDAVAAPAALPEEAESESARPAVDVPEPLDEDAFFAQDKTAPAGQNTEGGAPVTNDTDGAKGAVIDLADEGDIVLPALGEVVSGEGREPASDGEAPGNAGSGEKENVVIDEDDLLAQLEGIELEEHVTDLSGKEPAGENKRSDST